MGQRLGLTAFAALLLGLPGAAHAAVNESFQDAALVYRVPLPNAAAVTKVEFSVAGSEPDGWEVSIEFDALHCAVYCTYRLRRSAFGPSALTGMFLPPVTTILVYTGSASRPRGVVIDPAGLRLPYAAAKVSVDPEPAYLPGRRCLAARPSRCVTSPLPQASQRGLPPDGTRAEAVRPAAAPIRI